jgi:amidase
MSAEAIVPRVLSRRRAVSLLGASALLARGGWAEAFEQPGQAAQGDLYYLSLEDVAHSMATRELSPVELTRQMLGRIATVDPQLKSYATVMHDRAMADATAAEREIRSGHHRGPMHGVPIAVKDLCFTKGIRTMGGSAVLRNFVPTYDATVVSRLHGAGSVLLGKLNLSEGAAAGYNPAMDVPVNPWRADRWPGMSSSGSGVATAAGLCFAAIGTDTGGSIRFPASANGVVGLKPTYGRVSRYGVLAMAPSLDHVGTMARRVADAAIMLDAIAGYDPMDPTSLNVPAPNARAQITRGVKDVRLGVDWKYALDGIGDEHAAVLEAALEEMVRLGTRIVEVKMPDLTGLADTWMTICSSEMAAVHEGNYTLGAGEYGPYLGEFLAMGARVTPRQLAAAKKHRAELAGAFEQVLESVDAMAGPAGGDPAWPITQALQVGPMAAFHKAWTAAAPRAAEFTMPMDLAGVPAICLPCGFSEDEGLPFSIQFSGRRLSEATLCQIAYAYEQATSWHYQHPPV